ncbi:MAG: hypothetical protein NC453_16550 [Muribaculum sp.]|nr:hypothetical protein [Muribaculum sp.]
MIVYFAYSTITQNSFQRLGSRCSLPQRYGTAASEPLQESSAIVKARIAMVHPSDTTYWIIN